MKEIKEIKEIKEQGYFSYHFVNDVDWRMRMMDVPELRRMMRVMVRRRKGLGGGSEHHAFRVPLE